MKKDNMVKFKKGDMVKFDNEWMGDDGFMGVGIVIKVYHRAGMKKVHVDWLGQMMPYFDMPPHPRQPAHRLRVIGG